MEHICIFGGSFDPFHSGHKEIISLLIDTKKFDKILVTPSYANPLKDKYTYDTSKRVELIRHWLDGLQNPLVVLDLWEIDTKNLYTINMINHIHRSYPHAKLYLAIGWDVMENINKWKDIEQIARLVEFVLFRRDGYSYMYENIKIAQIIDMDNPTSSTKIKIK